MQMMILFMIFAPLALGAIDDLLTGYPTKRVHVDAPIVYHVPQSNSYESQIAAFYPDQTRLAFAAQYNQSADIIKFVKDGQDVNERSSPSLLTPLHFAALFNNLEAVKTLLSLGADAGEISATGLTVLSLLRLRTEPTEPALPYGGVSKFDTRIIQLLVDSGADITATDFSGDTVLHPALGIYGYKIEISNSMLDAFISCGAGTLLNKRNNEGKTPLNLAVELGFLSMTEYFIAFGADPNVADSNHDYPIHHALKG